MAARLLENASWGALRLSRKRVRRACAYALEGAVLCVRARVFPLPGARSTHTAGAIAIARWPNSASRELLPKCV